MFLPLFYVMEQQESLSLMFFNKLRIKSLQLYTDTKGIDEFFNSTAKEIVKTSVGI